MRPVVLFLVLALASACVTRVQVCVNADHGVLSRRDQQPNGDSFGGSVCADVERP